jgi:uncharacterized membrane protein YccC
MMAGSSIPASKGLAAALWAPIYYLLVHCKWPVIIGSTCAFFYNHDVPTTVFFIGAFGCNLVGTI